MKKNMLSILLLLNLIIFGSFLSSYITENKIAEPPALFIVEYSVGSNWDSKKDFNDQKYANQHSKHMVDLRTQGILCFGARYADKGIVFIAAKDLENAKQIVNADSAIINKMFNATINDLDVFYKFKQESTPSPIGEGKVTGIGGIFFKSNNSKILNNWYYDNLGLIPNESGSMFEWRNSETDFISYTQWSPFSKKTNYFNPSKKDFMINYRVDNMNELLKKLKANKVVVLDTIESYEYGKFLHILDCDSNKIELWEPIDGPFMKLYEGKTTK